MNLSQNSDLFQKLVQFSFHAVGYAFAVTLAALLFLAWLLTEPIFQLNQWITSKGKTKQQN
jgi:hypothetical protein